MRKVLLALVPLLLLAAACARGGGGGPLRYTVDVDARSSAEDKFQFSAYFPAEIRVRPGDQVTFRNRSTEAPHTLTFGVAADRSNQPPILTDEGENHVVTGPCDIDDDPTPELTECDSERLRPYDGSGYWNSGYLLPQPAPEEAGPKEVMLRVSEDIGTGSYSFVCILHPFMTGSLEVVADDGDRARPTEVRDSARDALAEAREEARGFEEPELEVEANEVTVSTGWGNRITSVNRFAPDEIEVEPGTTVNWAVRNPYEPHTVTFEPTFDPSTLPPEAFVPGGAESGSDYTGGFAHSGLIGAEGTPFEGTFSLRFTQAGEYRFLCALHPGQEGVVKVVG